MSLFADEMMGPERVANRQEADRRLNVGFEGDYSAVGRRPSFDEEPEEANPPAAQQASDPDPLRLDGIERTMYVDRNSQGDEMFNNAWMRDHWQGRQMGPSSGMLQGHGSLGSGMGADLLKADRDSKFVFADRLGSGPSKPNAPAAGWDRLSQGWMGAFFGGIFGGKGRAHRNQQQASRRKAVSDAFAGGSGQMPSWVQNSAYGRRKWASLAGKQG